MKKISPRDKVDFIQPLYESGESIMLYLGVYHHIYFFSGKRRTVLEAGDFHRSLKRLCEWKRCYVMKCRVLPCQRRVENKGKYFVVSEVCRLMCWEC